MRSRFDIEVVEHLKMVGYEPTCTHNNSRRVLARAKFGDDLQDVGAKLWLGRATGRLPRNSPLAPVAEPCLGGNGLGCRPEFIRVWIAGVDDALG